MNNFWDDWQKPWSKKQCKQRYVNGDDDISLEELSKVSGFSLSMLYKISASEKWLDQRKAYRSKLEAKTEEILIQKVSEETAEQISNYSKKHVEVCDTFIAIAEYYANKLLVMLRSSELNIDKLDGFKHNFMSLSLDRAISAQRIALGLDYEDVNKAINCLTRMGYEVTEPISASAKVQGEGKAKATKGISDATAAEIRAKVLGIESEDTPTLSAEVDS